MTLKSGASFGLIGIFVAMFASGIIKYALNPDIPQNYSYVLVTIFAVIGGCVFFMSFFPSLRPSTTIRGFFASFSASASLTSFFGISILNALQSLA